MIKMTLAEATEGMRELKEAMSDLLEVVDNTLKGLEDPEVSDLGKEVLIGLFDVALLMGSVEINKAGKKIIQAQDGE